MPFYSAIAELDITRKIAGLQHQYDPAYWIIIPVSQGVIVHFKLLREDSEWIDRVIAALTSSPVVHVETELGDDASADLIAIAESKLGLPYDFPGAIRAWDNSHYHSEGKEFCSGYAWEILSARLPGLQPYPNPGRLLSQLSAATSADVPKLAAPWVELSANDMERLQSLAPARAATGLIQETLEVLEAYKS